MAASPVSYTHLDVYKRQRLQEITAGIEQGIKELFESEKYMRYLSVMSKFHRYSVNNTMLIYMPVSYTHLEEEQKKGIIRTHYTIKTEKFLVVAFIVGTIFFACCTAMSLREKEDMFVICIFGIFFLVGISGIVNMVMWKLEVNGDEITWRSTFGKKRTFRFGDITYCERKKGSVRVYVNGEKLFTIDSNIDKEEFMEDIERRRIPVKSYWTNQHKKNRK